MKKNKKKKRLASWECYGGFDIWEGTCCTSGHFWGCETKKEAFPALLGVLKRFKEERKWTEEEYQKHLQSNLKMNKMEDMYEKYILKETRKQKIKQLKELETIYEKYILKPLRKLKINESR